MPFLSKLNVGSVLIYPTKDTSMVGRNAVSLIWQGVKQDGMIGPPAGRRGAIAYFASVIAEQLKGGVLADLLGGGGCLVPIPGHGVYKAGNLWPPLRICEELRRVGIGDDMQVLLERMKGVAQSSVKGATRPTVRDHYDSIEAKPILMPHKRIVMVDDVVTRGSTLIACGSRLAELFPGVEIVAFGYARIDWDARLTKLPEMWSPKIEAVTYDGVSNYARRD